MSASKRSAAGQAAGYHFQIQRALLSILRAPARTEISIETLDDLTLTDETARATTFEQLKHSVKPGSLSDRSRPLWRALDAWMDLKARPQRLERVPAERRPREKPPESFHQRAGLEPVASPAGGEGVGVRGYRRSSGSALHQP